VAVNSPPFYKKRSFQLIREAAKFLELYVLLCEYYCVGIVVWYYCVILQRMPKA